MTGAPRGLRSGARLTERHAVAVRGELILQAVRELCPPRYAVDGDKTGLQVGRCNRDMGRVLCTLDLTLEVAEEARDVGADVIISHHAVIFRALKNLRTDTFKGRILETLIKSEIAVYVPHTAMDVVDGGINDWLAKACGLEATRFLKETGRDPVKGDPSSEPVPRGIGRVGKLAAPEGLMDFVARLKKTLAITGVRVSAAGPDVKVKKVAVLSGDGRSFLESAIFAGADVMVTGDVDHHTALQARACGISLIDVGHWGGERQVIELLADGLRQKLEGKDVEILASAVDTNPFVFA